MSRIDARIILLQILVTAACMFWISSPVGILLEICSLILFLLCLRLPRQALKLAVYFIIADLLFELVSVYDAPLFFERIFFLLHRLSPMVGIVILSTESISVSQLVTGMQKLRCPKKMALTVAVALRFIPTISQELSQIKDALKTRGIPLNLVTFFRAPILTTEYVLVPFMMRGVRVADELSASAVTRAIENPHPRGERIPMKLRAKDMVYLVMVVLFDVGILIYDHI